MSASGEALTDVFGQRNELVVALEELRADETRRRAAIAVAVVVGIGLAWGHWLGLIIGGALVGLVQTDLKRAVGAGFGFGVLVIVLFVLTAPALGFGELFELTPVVFVTVGAGLVLPVLGSLVRGVV